MKGKNELEDLSVDVRILSIGYKPVKRIHLVSYRGQCWSYMKTDMNRGLHKKQITC
jgi:hypothetical protein